MVLVTDYVLPDGAVFSYPRVHGAPTSIRFQDGSTAPYKIYTAWRDMMRRASWRTASNKLDKKHYADCKVAEMFKDYFDFYEWSKKQVGFNKQDINGKIFSIDKDILSNVQKGYFPETVVFVPCIINNFFSKNRSSRYMRGVAKAKGTRTAKFVAAISINGAPAKYIAQFDTELDAHIAWCEAKNAHGKRLAVLYKDYIDPRVYERLINFDAFMEFN